MRIEQITEDITQQDLEAIEKYADKLFAKVGIDVEFTRHFLDRANDERNKKPITPPELIRIFRQEYKRWAKPIAQMGPDAEAVMKDMATDINVPFVLKWDSNNGELDLVAKTVMRKSDFKTPDREFPVEDNSTGTTHQWNQLQTGLKKQFGHNTPVKTKTTGQQKPSTSVFNRVKDTVSGWFGEDEVAELRIEKPNPKDTMGIKRANMPQIARDDYPEFIDYLKDNGATFTKETVDPNSLKPIQGEFSDQGVEKALMKRNIEKPIIASSDNYIIDGHHRWLAAVNTGQQVVIFRVSMPVQKLLKLTRQFSKTTYKDIYNEADEINGSLVDKFLKATGGKYSKRDQCGPACIDFISWAKKQGIELKRVRGEFVADEVVHAKADFTPEMKREFMQSGLDWNSAADRKAWIEQSKYAEEWKRVPHYWTVDKDGNIHDPSGYQQLVKTGLASDLDPSRYIPEGVKENTPGTIANKINWAGKNKTPAKPASQQQPKDNQERDAWWQLLKQRVMGEDKDYMRGHCHEWALKDIKKHPERKLYARIGVHYEDDIEEVDHVFTVDPKTGKAYDVRGEFATADALLADHDFGADEVFVDEISRDDIDHFCSIGELKPLDENFADGKVKGKSRPGRVKRAGASCKGSVSELRRKAKNSSGEKQKMYHWCANMKSGRKKTK